MKNTNTVQIRPKTTPVLESLKTHKIIGDQILAVQTAKNLAKTNPSIKLYESPSGRYIVTTDTMDYKEVAFKNVSLQSLRQVDDSELFDSRRIREAMRSHYA